MTSTTQVPAYPRFARQLAGADVDATPAEVHGIAVGLLCAGATDAYARWERELLEGAGEGDVLVDECRRSLRAVHDATAAALDDADMGLTLLLPDDDRPLAERADALRYWCAGFLYGLGIAGIAPDRALSLEGREALPPKSVAITIDDGYRATHEVAFPILRKYGFPATLFLYTDFVGAPDALTWTQMREMIAAGTFAVQPHSKSHSNLAVRQADENEARYRERVRREIDAPVEAIRRELGIRAQVFAFPYGDVNDVVAAELRGRGIEMGVTVTPGGNAFYAPPLMLRRTMIFGGDDLDAFRGKLVSAVPFGKP